MVFLLKEANTERKRRRRRRRRSTTVRKKSRTVIKVYDLKLELVI
jgi:hypothetical protein